MASSIAKRQEGLSATQFGSIAANVAMLNKSEVETYLDNLCSDLNTALDGKVDSVSAADNSVTVTGGKSASVGVKISAATGNLLELASDGLKVIAPTAAEYTIVKADTPETGYAATYKLTKDGTQVGASINIAKDWLLSGVELKTCAADDTPEAGYVVGDKYIEFTFNVKAGGAETATKLYLKVEDLVDVYTGAAASDGVITVAVSNGNVITATIGDGTIAQAKLDSTLSGKVNDGAAAKAAVDLILDGSTIDSFADVETALSGKQASLSETQLAAVNSGITSDLVTKLSGIAAGAEVNVQADWNETDTDDDAFIKNKPTLGSLAAKSEVAETDLASALATKINGKVDAVAGKDLSTNDFTDALKTKLEGIATGAEVNVQSDWNQSDSTADDFIKNKPTLGDLAAKSEVAESDLDSTLGAKIAGYDDLSDDVAAKVTAAAAVTIPGEDVVTLRSLRTAVIALKNAFAATAA